MKFYNLQIASKQRLIGNAYKITFAVPKGLRSNFQFQAGQYVTLNIKGQRRAYSLCSSPLDEEWSIGVKTVDNGEISTHIARELHVGDRVEVSSPEGLFGIPSKPDAQRAILAFAGGSGITPILSIARFILQTESQTDFFLFYSNKAFETTMFYDELKTLEQEYPNNFQVYFSHSQTPNVESLFKGRMNAENIKMIIERLDRNSNLEKILVCGPDSMRRRIMDAAIRTGFPKEDLHFERFTSNRDKAEDPSITHTIDLSQNVAVTLTLDGKTQQIVWNRQVPLLHALLAAGIDAPYSCARGNCGTCVCKLEQGEVHLRRNFVLQEPHIQRGLILTCVSSPVSDSIRISYDTL